MTSMFQLRGRNVSEQHCTVLCPKKEVVQSDLQSRRLVVHSAGLPDSHVLPAIAFLSIFPLLGIGKGNMAAFYFLCACVCMHVTGMCVYIVHTCMQIYNVHMYMYRFCRLLRALQMQTLPLLTCCRWSLCTCTMKCINA